MFSTSADAMLPFPPRPAIVHDRQWKPEVELAPNCPRCDSSNTKFCYYNNYSLSQPRYFCKGCRRYWTKGGSLRNVPVGGGCRKNRRAKPARAQAGMMSNGHQNQVPIRPDLVLDGMVGNSTGTAQPGRSTDGSTIDLAMLYAKYLNQSPETSEQSDSFDGSNCIDPVIELPVQLPNHGLLDWQVSSDTIGETLLCDSDNVLLGELGFGIDIPGCYESPDLPTETGYKYNYGYDDSLYSSSCSVLPNLLPDESLAILQESSINIATDWTTLDCPNLEALYKCWSDRSIDRSPQHN